MSLSSLSGAASWQSYLSVAVTLVGVIIGWIIVGGASSTSSSAQGNVKNSATIVLIVGLLIFCLESFDVYTTYSKTHKVEFTPKTVIGLLLSITLIVLASIIMASAKTGSSTSMDNVRNCGLGILFVSTLLLGSSTQEAFGSHIKSFLGSSPAYYYF